MEFSAFENCTSLTEITLPGGLESLSDNVFSGCTALEDVYLPGSVTHISDDAFEGCSPSLLLHGPADSEAERFAEEFGLAFQAD